MSHVAVPTGSDVLAFLGWSTDTELTDQADLHTASTARQARAYTRGVGFTANDYSADGWLCDPDIAAVIVSATARSLSNPTQAKRIEVGSYNEAPGSLASFSLLETIVLRGFRRTAA